MTHLLLATLTLLFLSALTVGPHIHTAARLRLRDACKDATDETSFGIGL